MGGGGFDEQGRVFSEINITPLTDVFLVLLIIFMVGASMAVDVASGGRADAASGVEVELPKGAAREIRPGEVSAMVIILADGRVILEGEETPDDILSDRLGSLHERTQSRTLVVQADQGANHGRVVEVMEAAKEAGFEHLALATRGD